MNTPASNPPPADPYGRRKRCSQCDMPNHFTNTQCWLCHSDLSHAQVDYLPVTAPTPSEGTLTPYARFILIASIPLFLLIGLLMVAQIFTPQSFPDGGQGIAALIFLMLVLFPIFAAIGSTVHVYRSGKMERNPIVDLILRGLIAISVMSAVGTAAAFATFIAIFLLCIGAIATGNLR